MLLLSDDRREDRAVGVEGDFIDDTDDNELTDCVLIFLGVVMEERGVEGGVDCGVPSSCFPVCSLAVWEERWNGEAIVVAADDTRSTGRAITFLKADR
jgi:hypothetical protein